MKNSKYSVEGGQLSRSGKFCPRCGIGVFLADHKDRVHCGRCGYTEFKPGVPRIKEKPKPKPIPELKKEVPKPKPAETAQAPAKGVPVKGGKEAAPAAPVKGAPATGKPGAKEEPKKEVTVEKGKKKGKR